MERQLLITPKTDIQDLEKLMVLYSLKKIPTSHIATCHWEPKVSSAISELNYAWRPRSEIVGHSVRFGCALWENLLLTKQVANLFLPQRLSGMGSAIIGKHSPTT
jgi:hypothetical protein